MLADLIVILLGSHHPHGNRRMLTAISNLAFADQYIR